MIAIAYAALFGIPMLAFFGILTYRGSATAVAVALIGGWLAMPLLALSYSGIPALDKESLLGFSVLSATWMSRPPSSRRGGPRWFDLPMIAWCLVPIASSLSNDLGIYNGVSGAFRQSVVWGAPYAIGRMICVDRAAMMDVGRVLLLGVVAYAPLCLIESRLSPQLHGWVYGMPGRVGWETVDFYGPLRWKASVFLQSPLELTPLMGLGFLFGWWMWRRGRIHAISGHSMSLLVPTALIATLMGKSLGGVGLTFCGACVLWLGRRLQTRVFLIALLTVSPFYMLTRTAGLWSGEGLVYFVQENISARRAESLQFRMVNEDMLVGRALEQKALGWGGWGRNRLYDEGGTDLTVTDGLWVIAFGVNGLVGLIAWACTLLLPAWIVLVHCSSRPAWMDPGNSVLQFAAVALGLHSIDCLANSMPNPIYAVLAGGICTVIRNQRLTQNPRGPSKSIGGDRPVEAAQKMNSSLSR